MAAYHVRIGVRDWQSGARGAYPVGWTGPAADGFRTVTGKVRAKVDVLSGDLDGTGKALYRHADDLDTVRSRMAQARRIAREAGLSTTETAIAEPGPAPAEPTRLPTDRRPTAGEQREHTAATHLAAAYAAKVRAYHQAADVVLRARRTEIQSQNLLLKFLSEQAEKSPFTIADFATDLAGGMVELVSKYRKDAARFGERARIARRLMTNPSMSARGQVKAAVLFSQRLVDTAEANHNATATRLARAVNRLPRSAKEFLPAGIGDFIKEGTPVLRRARPLLKRVPVAGAVITAAGVGYDITQGKDPGKAVASGALGFGASVAAGAAVGMVIGGPVGVVAGAVVGAGIGAVTEYAVDEWVYDAAVNAGGSVIDKAGDAFGDIQKGIGGLFD